MPASNAAIASGSGRRGVETLVERDILAVVGCRAYTPRGEVAPDNRMRG